MGFRVDHRSQYALMACVAIACVAFHAADSAAQSGYTSPFSITLGPDIGAWTSDFASRQATILANTSPPEADWYASTTTYGDYRYGPLNPQLYSSAVIGSPADAAALQYDRGKPVSGVPINSAPVGVATTTWQQQRILAAAEVLLLANTPYQHLHLPNFDPALVTSGTGFPWNPVSTNPTLQTSSELALHVSGTAPNPYAAAYGRPTAGIDCTDFTAYVYNLALGVQMHSGTRTQVEFTDGSVPLPGNTATATVLDTNGSPITPQFFYGPQFGMGKLNGPGSLDAMMSTFQTGDLLYIGDPDLGIVHVVMWLGTTGTDSAGNTFPLVISSHDNKPAIFDTLALDSQGLPLDGDIAGHLPPPGVHILPFASSNWFYQDFQLAMRVIGAAPVPEIDPAGMGGVVALVCGAFGLLERRSKARDA